MSKDKKGSEASQTYIWGSHLGEIAQVEGRKMRTVCSTALIGCAKEKIGTDKLK